MLPVIQHKLITKLKRLQTKATRPLEVLSSLEESSALLYFQTGDVGKAEILIYEKSLLHKFARDVRNLDLSDADKSLVKKYIFERIAGMERQIQRLLEPEESHVS